MSWLQNIQDAICCLKKRVSTLEATPFDPASPGPIGQTTPGTGNFTGLTISGTSAYGPSSAFSYASQTAIESQLTALGIPLNNIVTDATTARSLVLADAHKYITFTNAGAVTLTVPTNASVAFPIGTEIYIRRGSAAGAITLSNAGVTVNGSTTAPTIAPDGNFALKKKATNEWDLI